MSHTHVLSIDVGIRNLSYCILTCDDSEIHDWDNISLFENTPSPKCDGMTKGKNQSICGKTAKYVVAESITQPTNNACYRCMVHAKSNPGYLPPDASHKKSHYTRLRMTELREYASLISTITNNTLSTDDLKRQPLLSYIESVHNQYLFRPLVKRKVNAAKLDMCTVGTSIVREFDRIIESYDMSLTTVLIENQIGPIAMRMKTVQGMLTQYFLMRGAKDIRFVSSSNKLSDKTQSSASADTTTYAGRKKEGVLRVNQLLKGGDWEKWFETHTKKDDLADALLQGRWFLDSMRKRT